MRLFRYFEDRSSVRLGSNLSVRISFGGEMGSVFRLQSSLENVQEFRVDASNYPAEFGIGTGGQISLYHQERRQYFPWRNI